MNYLNHLYKWYFSKRNREIEAKALEPLRTQEETFHSLIRQASGTEWGKLYNYASIRNFEDYRKNVPVTDYESLKPYIFRLMKGEQNLLWPSKINWFAKSSGTTHDKSKFIPVSPEALKDCHFKGGKDMYARYLETFPHSSLFSGNALVMGGSHNISDGNPHARHGDLSAVLVANMPFWANAKRLPSHKTALMEDWEKKIDKIANETVNKKITHILGVPTWTVVLIQRLFEITEKNKLVDIWPDIELYVHGGVSFTPYQSLFNKLIGKEDMNYLETYNASEGFFALQDRESAEKDMMLMLDYGIYYEFLPMDEIDSEEPKTLTLDEVKTNTNYGLIISTNAGLWRYLVGDTIKFTSTDPYRIKVTGRTQHFINAFGEEIIVENVENALAEACKRTNASISDYTGAPVYLDGNSKGCHEYLIEFKNHPDCLDTFAEHFDNKLKSINSDYEAKRSKNMALVMPKIHVLTQGTFYNWMKKRGKLGGQNKVPRLSNNRQYVDDLLKYVQQ